MIGKYDFLPQTEPDRFNIISEGLAFKKKVTKIVLIFFAYKTKSALDSVS